MPLVAEFEEATTTVVAESAAVSASACARVSLSVVSVVSEVSVATVAAWA